MTTVDFVTNPFSGGGPRNVYTLSRRLNYLGYTSSIILFNELSYRRNSNAINQRFHVNIKKPPEAIDSLNRVTSKSDNLTFSLLPLFLFQQYITRVAALDSQEIPDAFISTFWQSVTPTHYLARKRGRAHFYFVQADETGFSQNKTYKAMARKTYAMDIPKFTHSRWLKEHLDLNYGGENEYIGMGIDHDVFTTRDLEMEPTVFTIARKDYDKGFDIFVKAMNLLAKKRSDFKVIIAGDGKIVESLNEKKAMQFPFEYIGWVNDDQVLAMHYTKSVFVNTGRFEALPMPPLEAMACGSSVVMTNMVGAQEYARNNENALLCPPGDHSCFAERIDELLSSENLRRKISREGIKTASNYTWENVTTQLVNFLKRHGIE